MEFKTTSIKGSIKTSESFLNELIDDIDKQVNFKGASTGFKKIDYAIGGLMPNTINYVTARTNVGKSNFLLNVARKQLISGKKVMYIDLESQGKLNNLRLASMISKRNLLKELLQKTPGSPEYLSVKNDIKRAINAIKPQNLLYISKSGLTVNQIQEEAQGLPIDLLIIDHLQKIKAEHNKSRYERYADIAEDLRILADNLGGVPLLVAAQLNRSAEGDKNPNASQIKGAGDVEENADTVIALTKVTDESGALLDKLKFEIVKGRHVLSTGGDLYFKRDWCLIEDFDFEVDNK